MRTFYAVAAAALLLAACSSESPRFSVAGARVDAMYWCPGGAVDARYDVHATVQVQNTTSKAVTIDSATADMVLARVTGAWLEPVGDRYDAGTVVVSPQTVPPSSSAKLTVTIPSSCTSARYGSTQSSSGSYTVTIHLATSAGAFSVTAGNRHEILAA
jgi:hypothetical protein